MVACSALFLPACIYYIGTVALALSPIQEGSVTLHSVLPHVRDYQTTFKNNLELLARIKQASNNQPRQIL